ncbi:HD domain-containing phosphohydrolase [uncultured Legionella sp.]|uniref:HD domain-containing phosphohydrolase n=1 Tax=uncultured Legionella sp. TaxID=210934 RepID=UPI002603E854|nr:HD domain-containing phosphohydrolase [uncultured Legionella sp.]
MPRNNMNQQGLNELYKNSYEQLPYEAFIFDSNGVVLSGNQAFCKLIGYTPAELSQMNFIQIQQNEGVDNLFEQVKAHGTVYKQITISHRNGTVLSKHIVYQFINSNQIQGVITKVHHVNKMLSSLLNNEELYDEIISSVHDVIYLLDLKKQNVLYTSPAFELFWQGEPLNLARGDFWLSSIHPEDREHFILAYAEQRETGMLDTIFRIIQYNGTIRWLHVRAYPVYNDQHIPYRSVGVAEDISTQVRLSQERVEHEHVLQKNFSETIFALASAQEQKDPYTVGHQDSVASLSFAIGQELNVSEHQLTGLVFAAHLHDIGKIGLPAELLTKPTKLSAIEFEYIKTHPEIGYNILKNIHFPWPIADIVYQHHERINGSGYPNKLVDQDILLEAKIIAVADTIDAMATNRPYRVAVGMNVAMEALQKGRGTVYDPSVVDALNKLYKDDRVTAYK